MTLDWLAIAGIALVIAVALAGFLLICWHKPWADDPPEGPHHDREWPR